MSTLDSWVPPWWQAELGRGRRATGVLPGVDARIRRSLYRLFPVARRPRAVLIGDEVSVKIGAYLLGNLITSVIAGLSAYVCMLTFGVPYPLLLASMVAVLLDLIPVDGTIAA
ncbi:AI-2E family transporter [Saccharopolyspora spinosa]|uniref:AI-2E family transporter n=1 Tax=Saccharopolyspora spinosa TaxID=60894 RepID=UPI0002EE9A5A|nr:AI-2E family transporter [Saccharopolyspora spinosa]